MPGARCTRSLAFKIERAHERSHHRIDGFNRHSLVGLPPTGRSRANFPALLRWSRRLKQTSLRVIDHNASLVKSGGRHSANALKASRASDVSVGAKRRPMTGSATCGNQSKRKPRMSLIRADPPVTPSTLADATSVVARNASVATAKEELNQSRLPCGFIEQACDQEEEENQRPR